MINAEIKIIDNYNYRNLKVDLLKINNVAQKVVFKHRDPIYEQLCYAYYIVSRYRKQDKIEILIDCSNAFCKDSSITDQIIAFKRKYDRAIKFDKLNIIIKIKQHDGNIEKARQT